MMNENNSNPLVSYGVLCAMLIVGVTPYLGMSAAYGTIDAGRWGVGNASSSIMIMIILIMVGVLFYLVRERGVDLEVLAGRIIDIEELRHKKYLDYILAHYGNVASVVAFLAVLVFVVKNNLAVVGIVISSIVLGVVVCLILFVYAFVFLKTVMGAVNRHVLVWISLMPMLFLDLTLMTMAIKGVPAS